MPRYCYVILDQREGVIRAGEMRKPSVEEVEQQLLEDNHSDISYMIGEEPIPLQWEGDPSLKNVLLKIG